ncbi:pPIWI_RE module domain-containing protein, partial [Streptomyces mauvecolor]
MSSPENRMSVLACPIDRELMGTVWLYPLPAEKIDEAWFRLRKAYWAVTGSDANLPYAGLLMVLRASGHTSASLFPTSKKKPPRFLALSRRLDRQHLHHAIALWEQALLHKPSEAITLAHPSELADLISSVEPEQVDLWDHLRRGARSVDADGWVFDAASWNLTRQLATTPFTLDGHQLALRADTENNLLAWRPEDLWSSNWLEARPDKEDTPSADPEAQARWAVRKYAALRIKVSMKSLHGLATPLAVLHPSASRLSNTLRNARTAWLAPKAPDAPLLSLHLGGRGDHTHLDHTSRLALDAWVRLRGERVFARQPDEKEFLPASAMDLSKKPGNLRALIPYSVSSPLGRGVGLYTVAELARHASTVLGQPLIGARKVPGVLVGHARTTKNGRDEMLLDDGDLAEILEAAGCSKLRILILYRSQDMRTRMQRLIAYHFNRPDLADGMPEDTVVELGPHAEALLHSAPEFLAHGAHHAQRPALAAQIPGLTAPDTGVLALCETTFDQKAWSRQRREARAKVEGAVDPYPLDAKPYVSRHLADHGVIAQFLTPSSKQYRSKKKERATTTPLEALGKELAADFPGHMAVGDMIRSAGLVHPRLTPAISFGPRGLKDRLAHVGLHLRLQLGDRRGPLTEEPKLMWTLVAFIPYGERQWATHAYLPDAGHGRRGWF